MSREENPGLITNHETAHTAPEQLRDNLLHWARVQKGNLQVKSPKRLPCYRLVEPSIEALPSRIDKKNLQISVENTK